MRSLMGASKSPLRSLGAGPPQRAFARVAGNRARGAPSARHRPTRRDCAPGAASQSVPARMERHGASGTLLPGPALDRARVATPTDPRASFPAKIHRLRQIPSRPPLHPLQSHPPLSSPGAPLSTASDTDHPTRLHIIPEALRQPALVSFVSLTRRRACVGGGPGHAHASLPVPPAHASAAPAGCGRLSPRCARTAPTPDENAAALPIHDSPSERLRLVEKMLVPAWPDASPASKQSFPTSSPGPTVQHQDPPTASRTAPRSIRGERPTKVPGDSRSHILDRPPSPRTGSSGTIPENGRPCRPLAPRPRRPASGLGTGRATSAPWHDPCARSNGARTAEGYPFRFLSPAPVRREEFMNTPGRARRGPTRLCRRPPPPPPSD